MTATLSPQPHRLSQRPPSQQHGVAARPAPRVSARRRLVVLGLLVALVASTLLLVGRVYGAGAELDGPPPVPPVYVVQPGDTLWSIAGKVAPSVDVREAVGQLRHAAGGSNLMPGQRIELPAGLAS